VSDGFQVNIGALQEASDGVSAILLYLRYEKVSDIGGNGQGYGNDSLASAVSDFCNRWEIGVENLAKDTQEIASRLSLSAQAYAKGRWSLG